ncbi:putative monodehydroascorbate reductase [Hibiscus syriacus]|uniref:Monodehydroascorbate reductase n=1 Tax=Hibiscus syriacus TaxID=106335 RepID=A0A6A3C706_HIBSY|nr:putative monodehydroascorbate reductase [Hibiscus syriacus]
MPATDYHSSFLGRISIRRNQIISMDGNNDQDLEIFSKYVSERFAELLSPPDDAVPSDTLLSISWLRKLLDVFLCCEAEFKAILLMGGGGGDDPFQISKPPLDRLIPELLDRSVKALDLCNAVTDGLESIRHYQKLAEIAASALGKKTHRVDDKEYSAVKTTERSWSFSRRTVNKDRSPSGEELVGGETDSGDDMQSRSAARGGGFRFGFPCLYNELIMVFVMWALVAAIPCQERNGLVTTHFPVPKQSSWDQSINGLHEKIVEEWKKKEKKGAAGLLAELQKMEKLVHNLMEFTDSFQFHGGPDEKAEEVAVHAAELAETCKRMEEGLLPLQMQIRQVFHSIVRSRNEFLHALDQCGKSSAPLV